MVFDPLIFLIFYLIYLIKHGLPWTPPPSLPIVSLKSNIYCSLLSLEKMSYNGPGWFHEISRAEFKFGRKFCKIHSGVIKY